MATPAPKFSGSAVNACRADLGISPRFKCQPGLIDSLELVIKEPPDLLRDRTVSGSISVRADAGPVGSGQPQRVIAAG